MCRSSSFSQIRDTCTGQHFLEILSDEFRVSELCMVLEGKIKKMPNSTTKTVALKAVEMLEHGQLKDIIDATKIRVDSMVESEAQASKTRNRKALVI